MMDKMGKILLNVINILLAFVILGIIFYRRVIYKRLELEEFPQKISNGYIILIICIIIYCLYKFYRFYNIIYELPETEGNKYVSKLFNKLMQQLVKPVMILYEFLVENVKLFVVLVRWLVRIALYIHKKIPRASRTLLLVLIYIPKVMVGGSLIVDVIIYNQLKYVYLFIPLLILPLIMRIFLYSMLDFCTCNKEKIDLFIKYEMEADGCVRFDLSEEGVKLAEKGEIDFHHVTNRYYYFILPGYLLIAGYGLIYILII